MSMRKKCAWAKITFILIWAASPHQRQQRRHRTEQLTFVKVCSVAILALEQTPDLLPCDLEFEQRNDIFQPGRHVWSIAAKWQTATCMKCQSFHRLWYKVDIFSFVHTSYIQSSNLFWIGFWGRFFTQQRAMFKTSSKLASSDTRSGNIPRL
jgi:hypothetical protein